MGLAFAASAFVSLRAAADIHQALHQVGDEERGVRLTLSLASAVRDEYAHLAHTIILGTDSHQHYFRGAHSRVTSLVQELEALTPPAQQGHLATIRAASEELARLFHEAVLPAVLRGERDSVQRHHAEALGLVERAQASAEALTRVREDSIRGLEAHASTTQHASFRVTVVLLGASFLFALGVTAYLARSIGRPLAQLEAGAARLGAGDMSTRIEVQGPLEFRRLAQQFNAMTHSLHEHQQRLVQTERLASVGRLAAGVAHELNNPLGVILGYTHLLRGRFEDTAALHDVAIIEEEARRARDIVEGLLDLSRPLQQRSERVNLRALCDDVIARLREAGLLAEVQVDVAGGAVVPGSERHLRQVVMNLVRNAAEAAGRGGRIGVVLDCDSASARLSVVDDGPGLTSEVAARLFEPFFTTKPHGTGLGLAVSRAIAQAHGGTLTARPSKGTAGLSGGRFVLQLPVRGAA